MRQMWSSSCRSASLVAWLVVAACGPGSVPLRESPRTYTASDYNSVYRRWTRNGDNFEFGRLTEILHVSATFESWEFRWAYVIRYAHDHSMTVDERQNVLEESLEDSRARHRFFVTASTPRWREGDLTSRQSDWRVLMIDSTGLQTEPVELTKVDRPAADLRAYFPQINRQRHTFRIAFPVRQPDGGTTIAASAEYVLLRFAGAAGIVDLRWDLDNGGAPL